MTLSGGTDSQKGKAKALALHEAEFEKQRLCKTGNVQFPGLFQC